MRDFIKRNDPINMKYLPPKEITEKNDNKNSWS